MVDRGALLRRTSAAVREHPEDVPLLLRRLGSALEASAVVALRPTRRQVVADCAWRVNRWRIRSVTVPGLDAATLAHIPPLRAAKMGAAAVGIPDQHGWDAGRAANAPLVLGLAREPSGLPVRCAGLLATAVDVMVARQDAATTAHRNALRKERARIASAIHQGASQELATLSVQLEIIEELLQRDPERGRELVSEIRASARAAMTSLRAAILDLTPVVPDSAWLCEGLTRLIDNFTAEWGLHVSFSFEGETQTIGSDAVGLVFTFVQEGMTNLRKHSASRRGDVRVFCDNETLRASVHDQGGAELLGDVAGAEGHGLNILWGRAHLLGGDLQIQPPSAGGTKVVLEIPI